MRRLACLGVALAALLTTVPSVCGELQAMSSAEKNKIRAGLEAYFKEKEWNRRDGGLLRMVQQVVADLDERRARSKKSSCLADVAGLRETIRESQVYETPKRRGLRKVEWTDSPFPGASPQFYVSVPKRYRPGSPAPLILALHPLGMDAESFVEKALLQLRPMQEQYVIVAPMWPDRTKATWGTETDEGCGRLLAPMMYAILEYFIDPDRVYVIGEGEGGTAALDLAMNFGDRFAGIFAIGGGKERPLAENLANLPVHRLTGGSTRPHLPAYDEFLAKVEVEGGLVRRSMPKKIDWHFTGLLQQTAWWLFVSRERARNDGQIGRIAAEIKDGNIVEVTTVGVDAFRLFLNDEMLDLDGDVQVIINGVKQDPWKAERKLVRAVEWMMDTGDLGRLYLASKEFAVPVPKEDGDKDEGD